MVLVALLLLASTAYCKHHLPAKEDRNEDNIYPYIDHGLKEKYWYYLTRACLLYLTSVERADDFQYLAIYRNLVGTFLAITTWNKENEYFDVNTLVRLGNGYEEGSGAHYKPIAVEPLKLRYTLGDDEYIIEISDCCDIKINGKAIGHLKKEDPVDEESLVEQCKVFSAHAKEQFWYYLQDAKCVYSSVGRTNHRNYCLLTYLNHAGTFLVIGTTSKDQCHVSTFVRLGAGNAEGTKYEPVSFSKIKLPLESFDE